MPEEKLFTPEEVAQKLKLSKYTIYEMIKRGDLQAHRVGRSLRISEQQLQLYLSGQQQAANTYPAQIKQEGDSKYADLINATHPLRFQVCTEREGQVLVTIAPEDIILSHTKLLCSARNIHPGTVQQLTENTQSMVMTLDIGVPLEVAITKQSVREMDIHPGDQLYAIFKTMAVKVAPLR